MAPAMCLSACAAPGWVLARAAAARQPPRGAQGRARSTAARRLRPAAHACRPPRPLPCAARRLPRPLPRAAAEVRILSLDDLMAAGAGGADDAGRADDAGGARCAGGAGGASGAADPARGPPQFSPEAWQASALP